MKQTAVQWLVEQIENDSDTIFYDRNLHSFEKYVEQAKEMEGEQREKDFVEGYKKRAKLSGLIFDESSKSSAKELFNKTLKSK